MSILSNLFNIRSNFLLNKVFKSPLFTSVESVCLLESLLLLLVTKSSRSYASPEYRRCLNLVDFKSNTSKGPSY